jgi:bifunctional non-homologous end joining protein LigD
MTLETYQAKRHFKKTPEPSGQTKKHSQKKADALRFVIQKHAASHLHYDFRLEADGVLKSWAVPKGPSLDPAVKRLAMAVEDHPLDYAGFEGTIPQGNYGAGTVMVWDEGTYTVASDLTPAETEAVVLEGLQKGKLTFQMQGSKLQGEFALVKTHRDENGWLLIKHKDEYITEEDILEKETSVLTQRTMAEIADGAISRVKSKVDDSEKAAKKAKEKVSISKTSQSLSKKQPEPFPHNMTPMMATLVDTPFSKPGWVYEIKWDGYRAIAELENGAVKLYSRNHQPFEAKYPGIVEALKQLADRSLILDGEVVALDADGHAHFQNLQDAGKRASQLTFMVFDLLYCDGKDLRTSSLLERKALLRKVLPENLPAICYCDHMEEDGEGFFQAAETQGLEGIIAKDGQSLYRSGTRSAAWLKIKTQQRQEAIICGYTEPQGSRKDFGALILGVYEEDRLQYIGHTGTGFTAKSLKNLKQRFADYETERCPFAKRPVTNQKASWLKPELVCEVKFTHWTEDGYLRQPVFLALREDKPAETITRENKLTVSQALKKEKAEAKVQPRDSKKAKTIKLTNDKKSRTAAKKQSPSEKSDTQKKSTFAKETPNSEKSRILSINGQDVAITHPRKLLWPETGYSKLDIANYYWQAASYILPYLKDRPFVMNRFPQGIHGEHFYQKDQPDSLPDWIETVSIYSESNSRELRYLLCQNEETLIYLANLGCIETHVWNVRQQTLHQPDWMVIDLDPEDIEFESIVETAKVVHEILTEAKTAHFCKTSGASGLHIYVPMGAQYDENTVRDFGQLVATLTHQQLPGITSLERSPAKRQKRIYLDYLQNRFGQTLVSPFSIRPTVEASVSMPLDWDEVKKGLHPSQFTIANATERFEDAEKLWQGVLGKGINLKRVIQVLETLYKG